MEIDPRLVEIENDKAPTSASFMYKGRLVVEEWTFLPLEKRQREGYIKADVPYYHLAVQPLSYKITDGGMEGDNLEHTYVAIKSAQGELTPKGSGRDEIVTAMQKLGFNRNTIKDLQDNPAVGKVFQFKRYNRQYKQGTEMRNGELMNVPVDILPDDWAPAPGTDIPVYTRAPRNRGATGTGVSSGSVVRPIGVSMQTVAKALAENSVAANESAVRNFILDSNEFSQGEALDFALQSTLFSKLISDGLVKDSGGVIAVA